MCRMAVVRIVFSWGRDMKFTKLLAVAGASVAAVLGSAGAVSLVIANDGNAPSTATLPSPTGNNTMPVDSFNLLDELTAELSPAELAIATAPNGIQAFGPGGGLVPNAGLHMLDFTNPVEVTFTYLGSEAGNDNALFQLIMGDTIIFDNDPVTMTPSGVGDSVSFVFDPMSTPAGIPFSLETNNDGMSGFDAIVTNGVNGVDLDIDTGLNIGFFIFNDGQSAIVFFGDGAGDSDYDDIMFRIDVAEVPIPGAALLFGTALIGGGLMRRKKKAVAQA